MKQKTFPPGWDKTGRRSGGHESPYDRDDCITRRTETQARILSLLRSGVGNAVGLRYLCGQTGFDGRTIRRAIREARLRGVPVISDNEHGYFLPADESEKSRFVRSMRHRAQEIAAAAAAVEVGTGRAYERKRKECLSGYWQYPDRRRKQFCFSFFVRRTRS